MGRSNPNDGTRISNPSKSYFKYSSSNKKFETYDKDKKEKVLYDLPFTFICLDECNRISGYDSTNKANIFSNDFVDMTKPIAVYSSANGKSNVIAKGLYKDIKESVKSKSGKFTKRLFVLWRQKSNQEPSVVCIDFLGASFGAWLEFTKNNNIYGKNKAVSCKSFTEEKNGSITFTKPVFELIDIDDAMDARAKDIHAEEVLPYINMIKSSGTSETSESSNQDNVENVNATTDDVINEMGNADDDLPF